MKILFPDFLDSARVYREAEAYWVKQWESLLLAVDSCDEWEWPWRSTTFVDGTPFQDGNPMFSAICPARKLGVRVIQEPLDVADDNVSVWINAAESNGPGIQELVLCCVLTESNAARCMDLLYQWVAFAEVSIEKESEPLIYAGPPAWGTAGTAAMREYLPLAAGVRLAS